MSFVQTVEQMSVAFGLSPGRGRDFSLAIVQHVPMPTRFAADVVAELARARRKHPEPINSTHEGFAVLMEEFEEVKADVFHGADRAALRAELVQVAAVAQRMAEDLSL